MKDIEVMVETLNESATLSYDGQRSDHPEIQSIIEHGFWIDDVVENDVFAYLYGIGASEQYCSTPLPEVLYIRNEGGNKVLVVFKINY